MYASTFIHGKKKLLCPKADSHWSVDINTNILKAVGQYDHLAKNSHNVVVTGFIAVKWHHDQVPLRKRKHWLVQRCSPLSYGREQGRIQVECWEQYPNLQADRQRHGQTDRDRDKETERDTGPVLSFWNLTAYSQRHTSSNKITPNPSNPFKQFYSLVTNHSNIGACEGCAYSNHHK